MRFKPDGSRDTSFGDGGVSENKWAVARFDRNGDLDLLFASDGRAVEAIVKFIDARSLDDRDLIVRGPDGSRFDVRLLRWQKIYNGRQRRVTYRLAPPGGAWDDADEGIYTVVLRSKQVRDNSGNFAAKGVIGTFEITVLD